jgi:hypothetical protein
MRHVLKLQLTMDSSQQNASQGNASHEDSSEPSLVSLVDDPTSFIAEITTTPTVVQQLFKDFVSQLQPNCNLPLQCKGTLVD